VAELREEKRERVLTALLNRAGQTKRDALRAPKRAKWKMRIAGALRSRSTAING
jgi:hypothetical protein